MRIAKYLVGIASGLTFGMLFAPKEGKKLRKEIKEKGTHSAQEGFQTLLSAFKEAGIEALDETKRLAENGQLSEAVESSKEKMREYFTEIEKTGYDIAARAKEKLEEIQASAVETTKQVKKKATRAKKAVQKTAKKAVKTVKKEVKAVERKVKKAAPKSAKAVAKKVKKKA